VPTPAQCPNCQAASQPGDLYCVNCGMSLASAGPETDFIPVSGVTSPPDLRSRKRHRKPRRRWYQRKRLVFPLLMTLLLVVAVGLTVVYISMTFRSLNELSTPPPEISGAQLGGDERLTIDTSPAQDAIREAEARREAGERPVAPTSMAGDNPSGGSGNGEGTPVASGTPGANGVPVAAMATPPDAPPEMVTVLLMGVDAREGEAIDVGVRPDSLAVATLDPVTGACRLLSIPRDSRVELPGYGPSKINHALAVGGVPYELLVVENLVGFRIDHYGLIDFGGLEQLVDAMGGVTVDNDRAFSTGRFDFPEGELRLDGEKALAYSRFRGDERGDFGRQERQQQVLRALLAEGADLDVVLAVPRLLGAVDDHVRTDMRPRRLTSLARDYQGSCTAESLETSRIEGEIAMLPDALFNQDLSFVVLDNTEVRAKVAWLLGEDEDDD
jgi:LCP family protein required for cell wall assembly